MIARHFRFFLAAAEEQSFQRAAERLHIAQSALSRRISDLERELGGVTLFERFARGVRLTQSGQSMLDDVRRIMTEIEEASRKARSIARGDVGLIRIGFADVGSLKRLIPRTLLKFEANYPEVEVQLIPMVSEQQRAALRAGVIEVGFMFDQMDDLHDDEPEFEMTALAPHRFVLVIPPAHRLSKADRITLSDLKDENLIWPSRRHAPMLYNRMIEACQIHDFSPRIKTEVVTVDMAYHLAATGIGLAMVLAEATDEAPYGLTLKPLEDFNLDMQLAMIWRRDNAMPALFNFIDTAKAMLDAGA